MKVGNSLSMPYYHSVIAEALSRAGRFEEAQQHIETAEQALAKHESDTDEVEFYRVKALVLWRQAESTDNQELISGSLELLQKAIDIATEQGAVSWKQVAEDSLAQITREGGRKNGTA